MTKKETRQEKVRNQIAHALFELMAEKAFTDIKVTDIVKKAGVARVSYYRNYNSKEEIIQNYVDSIRDKIANGESYSETSTYSYDNVVQHFETSLSYFLMEKSYILTIYHNGFSNLLLELLNSYIEEVAGDMDRRALERYQLYFISGAVFNVLIQWLDQGAIEFPGQIARFCADLLKGGILS